MKPTDDCLTGSIDRMKTAAAGIRETGALHALNADERGEVCELARQAMQRLCRNGYGTPAAVDGCRRDRAFVLTLLDSGCEPIQRTVVCDLLSLPPHRQEALAGMVTKARCLQASWRNLAVEAARDEATRDLIDAVLALPGAVKP